MGVTMVKTCTRCGADEETFYRCYAEPCGPLRTEVVPPVPKPQREPKTAVVPAAPTVRVIPPPGRVLPPRIRRRTHETDAEYAARLAPRGTLAAGDTHACAKLTRATAEELRYRAAEPGAVIAHLAAEYGIKPQTAWLCVMGFSWKSAGGPIRGRD